MKIAAIAPLLFAALACATLAHSAELPQLAGCYERVYDAAHLAAAHKGQIIRRVKLRVGPSAHGKADPAEKQPIVADAGMEMWVVGRETVFDTIGACRAEGDALVCNASLSAYEADLCKSTRDGVRDCRISHGESGSFRLSRKEDALLVSVRERLEMDASGVDAGPWLYLSPDNPENHDFLLKPAPDAACK